MRSTQDYFIEFDKTAAKAQQEISNELDAIVEKANSRLDDLEKIWSHSSNG